MNETPDAESNPYAPPSAMGDVVTQPISGFFYSTKVFAWLAILMIGSNTLILCLFSLLEVELLTQSLVENLNSLVFVFWVAGIAFFLVWLYRSAKNAIFFSGDTLSHSAGLAVAYYFIPFACWVKPIYSMSEIFDKTYALYQENRPVILLRLWWASWIIFLLLSRFHNTMRSESDTNYPLLGVRAFSSICVILVIHTLTKRQHQIITSSELMSKISRKPFLNLYPVEKGAPLIKGIKKEEEPKPDKSLANKAPDLF